MKGVGREGVEKCPPHKPASGRVRMKPSTTRPHSPYSLLSKRGRRISDTLGFFWNISIDGRRDQCCSILLNTHHHTREGTTWWPVWSIQSCFDIMEIKLERGDRDSSHLDVQLWARRSKETQLDCSHVCLWQSTANCSQVCQGNMGQAHRKIATFVDPNV